MLYNIKIYGYVYLFYYLVIYLVRSLVDGNIFVIGSFFCIIFWFFELGVIQLFIWFINVYFMFFIYVVCIRLYVLLDVVYSFKYYILKIKKNVCFLFVFVELVVFGMFLLGILV